ncbi:unnamed protein product, partial [Prorocentrum cordatum]
DVAAVGGEAGGGGARFPQRLPVADHLKRVKDKSARRALTRFFQDANAVVSEVASRYTNVRQQWNRRQLRAGDHLQQLTAPVARATRRVCDDVGGGPQEIQSKRRRLHANQWTLSGTLQYAFSRIGGNFAGLARTSHRELDAVATTALSHRSRLGDHIRQWRLALETGTCSASWAIVHRAFDLTPMTLNFGCCADLIRPVARFWWRDVAKCASGTPSVRSELISYSEYQRRGLAKGREPRAGVLHIMAQTLRVTWTEGEAERDVLAGLGFEAARDLPGDLRSESPVMPYVFMGSKGASTLWEGMEAGTKDLNWEGLVRLSKCLKMLLYSMGSDLDSSNQRLKLHVLSLVRDHNKRAQECEGGAVGVIAVLDMICLVHVLHRVVEKAFGTEELIPRLHSVCFMSGETGRSEMMLKVLKGIIVHDLEHGGFCPHARPPLGATERSSQILNMTLLRSIYTRGRLLSETMAKNQDYLLELGNALLEVANGDWRVVGFQHFCYKPGCCGGHRLDVCAERLLSVLRQAVFDRVSEKVPACNRWYTFGTALEVQGLGVFMHQILPRVIVQLHSDGMLDNDKPIAEDDPDVSFKVYRTKKVKQSIAFMSDPKTPFVVASAALATEPLDHMTNRMQHLDHAQKCPLVEFVGGGLSMQSAAMTHLRHLVCDATPGTPPKPSRTAWQLGLMKHLFGMTSDFALSSEQYRNTIIGVSSQVDARVEALMVRWPLKLLAARAAADSVDSAMPVLREFYAAKSCCLDEFFSEPFRTACPTIDHIDGPAWQFLQQAGRRCNVTNMPLENLLAQMKSSLGQTKKKPSVETLAYVAELSSLMKDHLAKGFKNSVVQKRSEMQNGGVPLEADSTHRARRLARPKPMVARPDMAWRNIKYNQWKREHPGSTPEERRVFFEQITQEWSGMSRVQRREALPSRRPRAGGEDGGAPPAAEEAEEDEVTRERRLQQWTSGNVDWPVSEAVLEAKLGIGRGVVGRSAELRWQARGDLVVEDKGAIPGDRDYCRRYSCQERHRGLCFTMHSHVYERVMKCALAVERFFTADMLHGCFQMAGVCGGGERWAVEFHFSDIRARRPFHHQTHSFTVISQVDPAGNEYRPIRCGDYDDGDCFKHIGSHALIL